MPGIFDAQKLSVLHDVPLQGAFVSPTAIETVQYQIARRADMYLPVGVPELVSLKALNYQTRVQEVLGYTGLSTWLMRAFSPVECYHSPKGISPQDTSAIIPLLVIDPSLITDSLAILLSQKSDENIDRAALRFKKLNESERTTLKIELIPALRELLMYLVPIDGE